MSRQENVYHSGSIEKISGSKAEVKILQQSACGSCHAKSLCSLSDMKEKVVVVSIPLHLKVSEGDLVTIVIERSIGMKAILYAYLLPFILLMATLIIFWTLTANEALSGLMALAVLVPYYFVIYLFRNKMKNQFIFRIQG